MKNLKEMTVAELRAYHESLKEEAHGINDKVEAETRDMNATEKERWAELSKSIGSVKRELVLRSMDEDLEVSTPALEARANLESVYQLTPERRNAARKFRELLDRGGKDVIMELRASVTATGTTESAAAISILAQDFIEPLNKGLIYHQLGLRVKEGLTANVKYPIMPDFEASFVNEKETVTDTVITETALTPVPRRIAISAPLTDIANLQTEGRLYAWILNNLAVAVARTINRWMFQTTPVVTGVYGPMAYHTTNNPVQTVELSAQPAYTELIGMRGKVQGSGAYNDGTYAYVMSGAMAAELEAAPRFTNGDTPILLDGKIGGCPVMLSEYIEATGPNTFNTVPKHVGFGRWSDVIVGQFGQMKLTVDPYSSSKAGVTNIVLNTEWSVDAIRKSSFVIGTVKSSS